MHNIRTNFRKFYSICKELFEKEVNSRNNFQFYPVAPKMNDLQIVALSCCMEALGVDSENLLWSKLKTDYMVRKKSFRSFKQDFETAPAKAYSAVNRSWYIGYKLHLIIYDNGVIQQAVLPKPMSMISIF